MTKNKITGKARKRLKKRISELKMLTKMYWHLVDIEEVFGMYKTDEEHKETLDRWKQEVIDLESKLVEIIYE